MKDNCEDRGDPIDLVIIRLGFLQTLEIGSSHRARSSPVVECERQLADPEYLCPGVSFCNSSVIGDSAPGIVTCPKVQPEMKRIALICAVCVDGWQSVNVRPARTKSRITTEGHQHERARVVLEPSIASQGTYEGSLLYRDSFAQDNSRGSTRCLRDRQVRFFLSQDCLGAAED